MMKAVIYDRFGSADVLRLGEIARPRPKANQVLIKVHAAALNPIDARLRAGMLSFITRWSLPRGTGFDVSGTVEELGKEVHDLAIGDAVFGVTAIFSNRGSCAEYALAPRATLARKPEGLTHAQAASLGIAGAAAVAAVDGLVAGKRLLVTGASGAVGFLAVQLARLRGVVVTPVISTRHVAKFTALGFANIHDYEKTPLAEMTGEFDRIVDTADVYLPSQFPHLFAKHSDFIAVSPRPALWPERLRALIRGRPRIRARGTKYRSDIYDLLAQQVVSGALVLPPLETINLEGVADAQRRLETKHAGVKFVVVI